MLVSIFQNWANLQKALESAQSRPESLAGSETGSKTDTECFRDDVKDELENDHTIMKKIIQEEGSCKKQNHKLYLKVYTVTKRIIIMMHMRKTLQLSISSFRSNPK